MPRRLLIAGVSMIVAAVSIEWLSGAQEDSIVASICCPAGWVGLVLVAGSGIAQLFASTARIDEGTLRDDDRTRRDMAILDSMTRAERANPTLITEARMQRIADGSGTTVESVASVVNRYGESRSHADAPEPLSPAQPARRTAGCR